MTPFSHRALRVEDLLGKQLLAQRQRFGWSLDEVAEEIRVPKKYLEALEKGDYKNLPSEIYSKNFLKKYLRVLGLPEAEYLQNFFLEKQSYETLHHVKDESKFRERVSASSFANAPKILRFVAVGLLLTFLLSYLALEIQKITAPPMLTIFFPEDNMVLQESAIDILGKTEAEAQVTINDEEVFPDAEGKFQKNVTLHQGINIIKISAKKKRSKETSVLRTFMVESNN